MNTTTTTAAQPTGNALVSRVKNILLTPKTEWPVIRAEPASVGGLYTGWLCLLAAIPAIAGFVSMSIIGFGGFGVSMRLPIGAGLTHMVVGYLMYLGMAYLLALIVNALAPTFGGRKDFLSALKVVAYGVTAAWLGGVLTLLPLGTLLSLLAALYSIYLLYLGLPVLMDSPPSKAVAYTAVVVICGFLMGLVVGMTTAALVRGPAMAGLGHVDGKAAEIAIQTPKGEVRINEQKMEQFRERMEAASRKFEEANRKTEAAAKTGSTDAAQTGADIAAAAKGAAEIAAAAIGSAGGRTPMAAQDLKAMLPESVAGLTRESIEAEANAAAGIGLANAKAEYRSGDRRLTLAINDTGGLAGLAGMAAAMNVSVDKDTQNGTERVYKQGNRTIRESTQKSSRRVEYTVMLPNGIIVEADGQGLDLAGLKSAVEGLPLAKLEAAK